MRDQIDRDIVRALRHDARLSVRALAEEVHISRSAAHERLRHLCDGGTITGFRAQVNLTKAGLPVQAVLAIDTGATAAGADLAEHLLAVPHVVRVQTIAGDLDYLVEIAAPNHEELSNAVLKQILRLPGIASVRTHLVIGECARDPLE